MRFKSNQMPVVFGVGYLSAEPHWRPFADIYRTPSGWLIKYDLAGVKMEDVEVAIKGSEITVSGYRRDWKLEAGSTHYSMEISYNRFERTIDLPCELEGAEVALEAREGILLVRLTCQGEKP
ncbi:MAG TPA: Hsp20/alpha crystallin family protein [Candidatus Binatia bacterium]